MLTLFSKLAKIAMDILMLMISLPKLTGPSTSLRTGQTVLQRACSCLIMLQPIKSEHPTHFLHARCPKIQTTDGLIIKAALACDQLHLLMDKFKNFTFRMTIHNIQDISKGWSK